MWGELHLSEDTLLVYPSTLLYVLFPLLGIL